MIAIIIRYRFYFYLLAGIFCVLTGVYLKYLYDTKYCKNIKIYNVVQRVKYYCESLELLFLIGVLFGVLYTMIHFNMFF